MFKKLFSRGKTETDGQSQEDELRLAVAALLVEAARADHEYTEREQQLIDKALASTFEFSAEGAAALRAKGESAQSSALDIQRFTRIAKRLSGEEKIAFAERLWEIILSDSVRDPYEDALMRRICGLIYLDDRESGAARARVAARLNTE